MGVVSLPEETAPIPVHAWISDFPWFCTCGNGERCRRTPCPVHVHVDRGERDKLSTVSNKTKAHDRVFSKAGCHRGTRHDRLTLTT